jgi:carbonic anhydrase/acetyltransferase-like protein (isoleucine patch superfamily)
MTDCAIIGDVAIAPDVRIGYDCLPRADLNRNHAEAIAALDAGAST